MLVELVKRDLAVFKKLFHIRVDDNKTKKSVFASFAALKILSSLVMIAFDRLFLWIT